MTLAILGVFLIICEFFYGIPFLGGSVILSFGWQPLLLNAFLSYYYNYFTCRYSKFY